MIATVFLLASLLTQLMVRIPAFQSLELELYDHQMFIWREALQPKTVDRRVVLVAVDDASKAGGWTDQKTLNLLEKLKEVGVAGVLVCGTEVFLSQPPPTVPRDSVVVSLSGKQAEMFTSLAPSEFSDFDGRVRSFPSSHPIVRLLSGLVGRLGIRDWFPPGNRFSLIFSKKYGSVNDTESYLDYLSVENLAQLIDTGGGDSLRGALIVLGRTTISGDSWYLETPAGKLEAGILYAYCLNTILEGWNLRAVDGWWAFFLSEILILVLAFGLSGRRPVTVFVLGMTGLGGVALVSLGAFMQGLWLPVGQLLVAVGGTAVSSVLLGFRGANIALSRLGGSENARLEGKETQATILFTELPAYLTDLERAQGDELLVHRREYNGILEAIARRYHGQILDYQGDFQMIGFGLRHDDDQEHPIEAASAALEIVASVPGLSQMWGVSEESLRVHAGVCTGPVALGHVGSLQKQDVAAIGDTTNTAARILASAISLNRKVLVAATTFSAAGDHLQGESLPPLELRNKSQPVEVFALEQVDPRWRLANLARKKGTIPSGGTIEYSPQTRGSLLLTLAFSLVAYLLSLVVNHAGTVAPWEAPIHDELLRRFGTAPSDSRILLVGMDAESSRDERLGPLPWPRSAHARVIENLSQTKMAGAFFDITFKQPNTAETEGDRALEKALFSEPRVSVGVTLAPRGLRFDEPLFFLPDNQREILRRRNQLGLIHARDDSDGVIRRAILAATATREDLEQSTVLYPTGALTLLLDERDELRSTPKGLRFGSTLIPSSSGPSPNELELRFGPAVTASPPQPGGYRYVSFHRLLDPADPIFAELDGAYLFVGEAFAGGERFAVDRVMTRAGYIKGVEIHARTLDTILNRTWLLPVPFWLQQLWILFLAAGTTYVMARYRFGHSYVPRVLSLMALQVTVFVVALLGLSRTSMLLTPLLTILFICTAVLLGRYLLAFRALSWFVPQEVADEMLLTQRARDRRVVATVLLTDIRGYTSISEGRSAVAMLGLLNEYHKRTVACYARYGGQALTYQGDAQIVVFGVFGRRKCPAKDAVLAALELQKICDELRKEWGLDARETFDVGAGLCTGMVEVGWLGGRDNLQYSVVGETVRKTHKVQSLSAELESPVLLDEETYKALGDELFCQDLGEVEVKGLEAPLRLYRPRPGSPEEGRNET